MWKFCGKAHFPLPKTVKTVETVPFHKISSPGNWVKFRYFTQCMELVCWFYLQINWLVFIWWERRYTTDPQKYYFFWSFMYFTSIWWDFIGMHEALEISVGLVYTSYVCQNVSLKYIFLRGGGYWLFYTA